MLGCYSCNWSPFNQYFAAQCPSSSITRPPSPERPGPISTTFVSELARTGFPLLTENIKPPGVIEVYPQPSLIELMGAPERLPYKATKVRNYWPDLLPEVRKQRLVDTWHVIGQHLAAELDGLSEVLPEITASASGRELKAYEDMLDAIVCVCSGICALEGRAVPYGDKTSAIWVPHKEG